MNNHLDTPDKEAAMTYPKIPQIISDPVNDNIQKLAALFPSAVKDGELDIDALKQELGEFTEAGPEKYELTWAGKQQARQIAFEPIVGKTLAFVSEDSKQPDTTENLFIEGDNLEVLKLLRQNYYGAVKLICIDPPYNTGNDFIYNDNFKMSRDESDMAQGNMSDLGERYTKNRKDHNRYHANWLNMMYPRLLLAKELLTDDGAIFISIDDHEAHNLRNLCDEIFGIKNFLIQFSWRTDGNFDNQAKFKKCHEYILCYAKKEELFLSPPVIDPNVPKDSKLYKQEIRNTIVKNGPKNPVSQILLPKGFPAAIEDGVIERRTSLWPHYSTNAIIKNGKLCNDVIVESGWSSKDLLTAFIENDLKSIVDNKGQETYFVISQTGAIEVVKKRSELQSHVISSLQNLGGQQKAEAEIQSLKVVFGDYPKPISLLKYLCSMIRENDSIFLDFFAGSATTAHAVMKLNAEDGGNRKYIMVQLPEPCDENSEAYKAGYKNICEIGKERIRRAGEKILEENKDKNGIENLDIGFKVFRVADTNVNWLHQDLKGYDLFDHYDKNASDKDKLDFMPGFTDLDVVYEIMLRQTDIPLSSKVFQLSDIGSRTYMFADSFVVCLEQDITRELIDRMAAIEPLPVKFVFRDSAFDDNIALKDETFRRLNALIEKNSGGEKPAYTVEFI